MDNFDFLRNEKDWQEWVTEYKLNIYRQGPPKPEMYPCYAYLKVLDWHSRVQTGKYLYLSDTMLMVARLSTSQNNRDGSTCDNCKSLWPCKCEDPVFICGKCALDWWGCSCESETA